PAWYQKEVIIPQDWNKKHIILFLERVHWESRLWVDGKEIGMQNSLSAPHIYDLTKALSPGKHNLTLRIDNRIKDINPGKDSHSITDNTQGNWNGIVGKIQLIATPKVWIKQIQTFPDIANKSVKVKLHLHNGLRNKLNADIVLKAHSFNSDNSIDVEPFSNTISIHTKDTVIEITYPVGEKIQLCDEFHPALY